MLRMARESDGLASLWISWNCIFLVMGCLSLLPTPTYSQALTPEDAKAILDQHNEFRRQESAANMYKLHWNMTLQERADGWARKCLFKHERNLDIGENLFFDGDQTNGVFQRGVRMWHDEKSMYSYTSDACLTTCHYTMIVTGYVVTVGCSANVCPTMKVGSQVVENVMYLVCYYYPRGNFVGHFPFVRGAPCSKCAEGDSCSNKLCVSSSPEAKSAPNFIKSLLPLAPPSPHRPIQNLAGFEALVQDFGGSQTPRRSSSSHHQHSHHRHHHRHHHKHHHGPKQPTQTTLFQSNNAVAQPFRNNRDRTHSHHHKPDVSSKWTVDNTRKREEERRRAREKERIRLEEEEREQEEQRKRGERERQAQRLREERERERQMIKEEKEREAQRLREQREIELQRQREQREREQRERVEREKQAKILKEEQEREEKRQKEEEEERRLREAQRVQRLREEQEVEAKRRRDEEKRRLREEQEIQRLREEQEREAKRQKEEEKRLQEEHKLREEQELQAQRERLRNQKKRLSRKLKEERQELEREEERKGDSYTIRTPYLNGHHGHRSTKHTHSGRKSNNRLINASYNQRGIQTSSDTEEKSPPRTPNVPVKERSRYHYHHHRHHRVEETPTGSRTLSQGVPSVPVRPSVDSSTDGRVPETSGKSTPITTHHSRTKQRGEGSNSSTRSSVRVRNTTRLSGAIYTNEKSTSFPGKLDESASVPSVVSTGSSQRGQISDNNRIILSTSGSRNIPNSTHKFIPLNVDNDQMVDITSSSSVTSSTMTDLSKGHQPVQKTPHSSEILQSTTPALNRRQYQNNRYHHLNPSYSNIRPTNVGSGFVATIVKIGPQDPNRQKSVNIARSSSGKSRNNETTGVQNRNYENYVSTGSNETVKYDIPKKRKKNTLRVKMTKLAIKRARRRRKRFHRRVLARLSRERHPHKDKYTLDRTGRRCVDRLSLCSQWVAKCHRSAVVTLSCPMTCGKCGHHIDVDIMLKDDAKRVHDRGLFFTKRRNPTGYRRRRKKKKNRSKNQTFSPPDQGAPQSYVLAPGSKAVDSAKRLRNLHRRKSKNRDGQAGKRRQRKKGRRKKHRKNGTELCHDDPHLIRSCRFWAKRGFCEDNQLLRNVFCRWSCGVCD